MVKGIHVCKLSKNAHAPSISVKSFPGTCIEDMESYSVPTIRSKPDEVILHVETNDLQKLTARQAAEEGIVNLADNISQNCGSKIAISSISKRLDKPDLNPKLEEVNNILKKFSFRFQVF